jgi:hypothetical protein
MNAGLVLLFAALPALTPGAPASQTAFLVSGAACDLGKDAGDGLRTVYWELLQLTEICVPVGTDSPALSMSLVLVYAGRPPAGALRPEARGTPSQVLATVRSTATAPLISPRFTMTTGGRRFDLAGPGRQYQVVYPCDLSSAQCSYDGVISRLQLSELTELSRSSNVAGHALGTDFALTASGRDAVGRMAARAAVR